MSSELISSTLIHKIRPPDATNGKRPPVLILLHGRGTNEDDLMSLGDYLDPRFFIVSARAPYRYQEGFGGYSWYDVQEGGTPDLRQFEGSFTRLIRFIADVQRGYPVDARNTFLLGFSMGSIMSFAVALSQPQSLRGIAAHSGFIQENVPLKYAWNGLRGLSIFIAHGVNDPVIPIHLARRARELLSGTQADLTYAEYPIPHTISEESLSDLASWLQKKLDVPADMK